MTVQKLSATPCAQQLMSEGFLIREETSTACCVLLEAEHSRDIDLGATCAPCGSATESTPSPSSADIKCAFAPHAKLVIDINFVDLRIHGGRWKGGFTREERWADPCA